MQLMDMAPHSFIIGSGEKELKRLLSGNREDKVEKIIEIYKNCNVDDWARELKEKYLQTALQHLEKIAVVSARKKPLQELAEYLIHRQH